jgi:hypothetical protein
MSKARIAAIGLALLLPLQGLHAEIWVLGGTTLTPDEVADDSRVVVDKDVIAAVGKVRQCPTVRP